MANAIRKRVALAAVIAVATGLLSAVPAQAAVNDTLTFKSLTPVRANSGQYATLTLTANITNSTITGSELTARLLSAPAGATLSVDTDTVATSAPLALTSTNTFGAVPGAANISADGDVMMYIQASAAGAYQFAIFEDELNTSSDVIDPTEPFAIVSFTTTGVPTSIAVTAPVNARATVGETFTVVARDANGNATQLAASEWVAVASTAASVAVGDTVLDAGDFATGQATAVVTNADAGTAAVVFTPSGLFAGAAVTSSLVTATFRSADTLTVTNVTGVGNATLAGGLYGAAATAASGTPITASTETAKSLTFRVNSATAGNVIVTVSQNGSAALPAGITAGQIVVATSGTSPSGTFTLTATAPSTGSTYRVTTGSLSYVVTYAAPTIDSTRGVVTLDPDTATVARTIVGGTATVSATVTDAWGEPFAGANVVFTVTGRNTYIAAVATNASGVATYRVLDASTSTTSLVDTVSATAQAATASSATTATTTSFTYVTSVAASSLTLTSNASTTAANLTNIDETFTVTATARNAAGAGMQGLPVTFTLPAGVYTSSAAASTTVYTNSSGVATLIIAGTRVGASTVTATAGGQTATHSFSLENTAGVPGASPTNGDARVIALNTTTASMPGGATAKITATVTDRYGNPVSGVTVSVSYAGSAGRVAAVNGIIGSTGTTNTSGQVVVDVAAATNEAGSGTLVVSYSGGDASTATLMANRTPYTARVLSATLTATITQAVDVNAAAIAKVQEQVTALAASVTSLIAALSAQVRRLQTALTNLRTLVRGLR